jgi:hypothetical protein
MSDYSYPGDDGLPDAPLDWWTRWRLRAPQWPFLLAAVLFGGYFFWEYRSPAIAVNLLSHIGGFFFGALFFGLLAVVRGAQVLVRYSTELTYRTPHQFLRFRSWCLPWLFLIAAVIYYGVGEDWPMRISFWWSRSALDRLANKALADPDNAHLLAGQWAGVYRIVSVEVIGSTVILYLDEDKRSEGFVREPRTSSDNIQNQDPVESGDYHLFTTFPKGGDLENRVGKRMSDEWFVMYSY